MRDNGVFPSNVSTMSYDQSVEAFLGGNAAMLNSGVWDTKKFDQSDLRKIFIIGGAPLSQMEWENRRFP